MDFSLKTTKLHIVIHDNNMFFFPSRGLFLFPTWDMNNEMDLACDCFGYKKKAYFKQKEEKVWST